MIITLPATQARLNTEVLDEAALLLPPKWDNERARVMLLAIAQQESELATRRQYNNGPARGLWQFERGTAASRGGVWGVFLHPASRETLAGVCAERGVVHDPLRIWEALERDDILAACVARLLLYTDSQALPSVADVQGAWELYAVRTWRPGKPHRSKWDRCHRGAREALGIA